MGNQFYYSRREIIQPTLGDAVDAEPKFAEFIDSFNINLVLRSRGLENGTRMVLLNDLHEQWVSTPVVNKMGKIASYKRERDVFQSEIFLDEKDSKRFMEILSITD